MKALLIARVSTEEQEVAGNSLPAQVERMKKYCERKGLQVGEIHSFDESAYKQDRQKFDSILQQIQGSKEKIAVCFDKVDRFSRNVFDKRVATLYELAMGGQIELHFASDNQVVSSNISAGEKFQFGISLGLAKYYSDAISDNTRRAFEQKRRKGEWTGHPRIGYINIQNRDDAGNVVMRDIIPDPERAHLIQSLFSLYATGGYSLTTLWQRATTMGLRSLDGQPLSRSNIELILKDSFYYGIARSKQYGEYPHRYACLITKDLFDRCRDVMEGRSKSRAKEQSRPYILKGLLHCARCACLMTPEIKKGRFIYYSCTNAKGICKRVYVPEAALLKPVLALFKEFENVTEEVQERLVSELRQVHEGEALFHVKEISRIRASYDRVQRRQGALVNLLLDAGITQDDYDKKYNELKEEQYKLNIELEEHTKADHQFHVHVATVLRLSRNMGQIFASSEVSEKRAILNYLFQNPQVDGKKLSYSLKKPFAAVLDLARRPVGLRG